MSIMYHMYGSSMGSLIIYVKMNGSETVEWIKSGNHPDQWFEAAVFFNSSAEYKVSRVFPIFDCCRYCFCYWLFVSKINPQQA